MTENSSQQINVAGDYRLW